MEKLTMTDCANGAKVLLEICDKVTVDEDWYIYTEGKPVCTVVGKSTGLPMRLIHENMQHGEYRTLNPFIETGNSSKERNWLFNLYAIMIGATVKDIILKIIDFSLSEEDDLDYKAVPLVVKYMKAVDTKTKKEIEKLRAMDFAYINYDIKTKKAELYCRILEELEEFDMRKKTKQFIVDIMRDLLGDDAPVMEYQATVKNAQQLDAMLNIIGMCLDKLAMPMEQILDRKLDLNEFHKHKNLIEAYSKVSGWCVSAEAPNESSSDSGSSEEAVKPWLTPTDTLVMPAVNNIVLPDPVVPQPIQVTPQVPIPIQQTPIQPTYHQPASSSGGNSWFDRERVIIGSTRTRTGSNNNIVMPG